MKVGHIVNLFDPSCDVLRCVRELNLHSRHSHDLFVRDRHPDQDVYQFEEAPRADAAAVIAAADVLIYHFAGLAADRHDPGKPSAFRSLHITWEGGDGRFRTTMDTPLDDYRLLSASHVGATDFLPEDRFRWLPDLLPLDGPYQFDPALCPVPAVSYIKHAEQLREMDFGGADHLDCSRTAHATVLARRRSITTVVIDNVCDGHYGLAGQEAAIFGLPVVGFNHPRTLEAMEDWRSPGTEFPFIQAETVDEAARTAVRVAGEVTVPYRRAIRAWAGEFLDPRRLIGEYWDPFIDELAG